MNLQLCIQHQAVSTLVCSVRSGVSNQMCSPSQEVKPGKDTNASRLAHTKYTVKNSGAMPGGFIYCANVQICMQGCNVLHSVGEEHQANHKYCRHQPIASAVNLYFFVISTVKASKIRYFIFRIDCSFKCLGIRRVP